MRIVAILDKMKTLQNNILDFLDDEIIYKRRLAFGILKLDKLKIKIANLSLDHF